MNKLVRKDKKNRRKFVKTEIKSWMLKGVLKNNYMGKEDKERVRAEMNGMTGWESKIVNRCIETGRGRGVFRAYKLSRMTFKEEGKKGYLAGVRKGSW